MLTPSKVTTTNAETSPRSQLEIRYVCSLYNPSTLTQYFIIVNRTRDITPLSHPSFQRPELTTTQSLPVPSALSLISSDTSSPPPSHLYGSTLFKKRRFSEIIDLTVNEDDFDLSESNERKKSRSSSSSAEAATYARIKRSEIVDRVSPSTGMMPSILLQSCIRPLSLAITFRL